MGKTSLKLLVMEAQIMCVLEREDISAKGEEKKYFLVKKGSKITLCCSIAV